MTDKYELKIVGGVTPESIDNFIGVFKAYFSKESNFMRFGWAEVFKNCVVVSGTCNSIFNKELKRSLLIWYDPAIYEEVINYIRQVELGELPDINTEWYIEKRRKKMINEEHTPDHIWCNNQKIRTEETWNKYKEGYRNLFPGYSFQWKKHKEGYRDLFFSCTLEKVYGWKYSMLNNDYIPKKVLFNGPATIAFWKDGTKTVIKCSEDDAYDPEKAVLWAIFEKWICPDGKFSKTSRRRIMEELTKDALNEWPEDGFSEDWVE